MAAEINRWRTPEDVRNASGLIGPNAILQLLPVLDRFGGSEFRSRLLYEAGLEDVPDGSRMIPETDVARLHQYLRMALADTAPGLAEDAGRETANYVLAHRIPWPIQTVLRALPSRLAASLLARAIAKHAWTFVGSGQFHVIDPWTFEIEDNPLVRGEQSDVCLCNWHTGVFARLYQKLVSADCDCSEVQCGAQSGHSRCRFALRVVPKAQR